MVLAEAEMERVTPTILVELGRQVVEGIRHIRIIRASEGGHHTTHSKTKQKLN